MKIKEAIIEAFNLKKLTLFVNGSITLPQHELDRELGNGERFSIDSILFEIKNNKVEFISDTTEQINRLAMQRLIQEVGSERFLHWINTGEGVV